MRFLNEGGVPRGSSKGRGKGFWQEKEDQWPWAPRGKRKGKGEGRMGEETRIGDKLKLVKIIFFSTTKS